MASDDGRQVQVRLAMAADQSLRLVRGRVRGVVLEDGPILQASLEDISQAARVGLFANGGAEAITHQAAFAGPGAYEFALRMQGQHVSLLRVLANLLRVKLGSTEGSGIDIELWGYEEEHETRSRPTDLLPAADAIAYLEDYGTLPFAVDLGMLSTDRDHVVRVRFRGDLSNSGFQSCVHFLHFWHRLVRSGAYVDAVSMAPPFVQEALETFMMARDIFEGIVLGLRQADACWYGLCAGLGWVTANSVPIRRAEIE